MARRAVVLGTDAGDSSALGQALKVCRYEAVEVRSEAELTESMDEKLADLVVIGLPEGADDDALRVAEDIRRIDRGCAVVLVTANRSAGFALGALRAGVRDLLERDAPGQAVAKALRNLSGGGAGEGRLGGAAHGGAAPLMGGERMVGRGRAMGEIRSQIASVAVSEANVLLTGESGTGKELAAELIHRNSGRSAKPFVAMNCAAVPDTLLESELFGHERGAFTGASAAREGKLQYAAGGTLFLDEVGDMSLASQAKILRAIETRVIQRLGSNADTKVQARLIAATNQDLEKLTAEKRFRQDLYFRLNVIRIHLPPLRERREDIPELAEHILGELSAQQRRPIRRFEGDVIRRMQMHDWPGNIRELRNVIESILVFSSSRRIGLSDVPAHVTQRLHTRMPEYENERSRILSALSSTSWNRGAAATVLRCSRMTLYRKMVKYAIVADGG